MVGMDDRQKEVVERETAHDFATAEARWEYERIRRKRLVIRSALGFVFLVAFGYGMYRLGGGAGGGGGGGIPDGHSADDGHDHGGVPVPGQKVDPVGSPQGKVKIEAIIPSDSSCHTRIIEFVTKTVMKNPDKMYAEFANMHTIDKSKLSKLVGSECAAVIVNGTPEYKVTVDGVERTISLVGTEPTHYSLDDIGLAITAAFTQEYGAPDGPLYELPEGYTAPPASERPGGKGHYTPTPPEDPEQILEEIKLPAFDASEAEKQG